MNLRRLRVLLLLLGAAVAFGFGARLDDMALRDSMMAKGSLMGQRWLEKNGFESYLLRQSWKPTADSGLRCVGRWSYGPSLKVSLRVTSGDTVICLTRGSGATLARFRTRDSVTFDLLGDLDFAGIPRRAVITDTLIIAGIHSGGTGLEIHGVSNPGQPNLLSRVDLPVVNDIAVKDSFVYAACEDDTLRIYSIANPRQPVLVGACCDSCDLFMTQAGNYCYLVHVSGVNIVDVSNPASPHRAGRIGGEPLAVYVRDTLCYDMIFGEGLRIYNVKDAASPHLLGSLTLADAMDLTMPSTEDTLLYTSLLDVVNVTNPASPSQVGHVDIPAEDEGGVAVVPAMNCALVANYTDGVVAVDITNPANPTIDTTVFGAGSAQDIYVDGTRAYLASPLNGMTILDVSNPTRPTRLGGVDIVGLNPACMSVVARDSFAYMHWYQRPQFQSVDVSDPTRPQRVGGADVTNPPEDMVIRDSFVYCAEANRFQIVNVARPREPVLVGSCVSTDGNLFGLSLQDSFAYEASLYGMWVINVVRPDSPFVVSSNVGRNAAGIAARDTFVYLPAAYDTLWVYSVANPASPRVLGFAPLLTHSADVALGETTAAVATAQGLELFNLSDPAQPRRVASIAAPYALRRVAYAQPCYYAAMWEAGVAIYDAESVGLEERGARISPMTELRALPNPARNRCLLSPGVTGAHAVRLRDVAGRVVPAAVVHVEVGQNAALDLSKLAPGVYFVEVRDGGRATGVKLVKQ